MTAVPLASRFFDFSVVNSASDLGSPRTPRLGLMTSAARPAVGIGPGFEVGIAEVVQRSWPSYDPRQDYGERRRISLRSASAFLNSILTCDHASALQPRPWRPGPRSRARPLAPTPQDHLVPAAAPGTPARSRCTPDGARRARSDRWLTSRPFTYSTSKAMSTGGVATTDSSGSRSHSNHDRTSAGHERCAVARAAASRVAEVVPAWPCASSRDAA
jgi:hypothetical protein